MIAVDTASDDGNPTGADGFGDGRPNVGPAGFLCQPANLGEFRTPAYHGRIVAIYLLDSDGFINPLDPSTDDSILYVGMDIANGDRYNVTESGVSQCVDVDLPTGANPICRAGLPDSCAPVGAIDHFMVPFDGDGDGSPLTELRFDGNCNGVLDPAEQCAGGIACIRDGTCGVRCSSRYGFEFRLCDGRVLLASSLEMNNAAPVEIGMQNNVPLSNLITFPCEGMTAAQLALQGQRAFSNLPADAPFQHTLDVEYIVEHVDTLLNARIESGGNPADPLDDYATDRLLLQTSSVTVFSDTDGDSGEDFSLTTINVLVPQIEVVKEIRCQGETAWRVSDASTIASVQAVAGSYVEFRITVENTGNLPLNAFLTDVLEEFNGTDFVLNPALDAQTGIITGRLFRNGVEQPLFGLPGANPGLLGAPLFFDPTNINGFLNGINAAGGNRERYLGLLQAAVVCTTPRVPGDRVELVLRARVNNPCTGNRLALDGRNSIRAFGDPDTPPVVAPAVLRVPAAANGDETIDAPDLTAPPTTTDTPREVTQGFDDNVVTVDVLCGDLQFSKQVRVCAGTDCTNNACPGNFADSAAFGDAAFPICINYRYRLTNNGEVPESVVISDPMLCADVTAAGATLVSCDVCPTAAPVVVAPGATVDRFCTVRIATIDILNAFLMADNTDPCPGAPPPAGTPNDCYRNCATATATFAPTAGTCGSGSVARTSTTEVCRARCEVTVRKQVRCIPDCNSTTGAYSDCIAAVEGACVQYEVEITSIRPTKICDLRITDILLGQGAGQVLPPIFTGCTPDTPCEPAGGPGSCITNAPPGSACITFDNSVQFSFQPSGGVRSNLAVPPAGFNVNGNSFSWLPCATPGQGGVNMPMMQGDKLFFTFRARVPSGAVVNCTSINRVAVECRGCTRDVNGMEICPATGGYETPKCADACVDVIKPGLICETTFTNYGFDANANCVADDAINNPFGATACDDLLDKPFPMRIQYTIKATNTGDVPISVTAMDSFKADIAAAGGTISYAPSDPMTTPQIVAANNGMFTWTATVTIPSVAVARQLALLDAECALPRRCTGPTDPPADRCYNNCVKLTGVPQFPAGTCLPAGFINPMSDCNAEVCFPGDCSLDVTKTVRCVNPDGSLGAITDSLQVVAGGRVRFVITVLNNGALVKLPRICITDMLPCAGWSIAAGSISATLAGTNVSADFSGFTANGVEHCFTFGSRPAMPWIAPSESLILTFDVIVPAAFAGSCTNTVTVKGYPEACSPPNPQTPICTDMDTTTVTVVGGSVDCTKSVCALTAGGGTPCAQGPATLTLSESDFPATLTYTVRVTNTGQLPLVNIAACDIDLVTRAQAAGITFGSCDFCDAVCDGSGDDCAEFAGPIAAGGTHDFTCVLTDVSFEQFKLFGTETSPDSGEYCFSNSVTVTADASLPPGVCGPAALSVTPSNCGVQICASENRMFCCPPVVKAKFDIWNGNEVRFSGTERCICSWDTFAIRETTTADGLRNHMLKSFLQTDKGYARIDGLESAVCDTSMTPADRAAAPLLGLEYRVIDFFPETPAPDCDPNLPGDQQYRNPDIEVAAAHLVSRGQQAGVVNYLVPGAPPSADVGPGGIGNVSQVGSFLVLPYIELKWDCRGVNRDDPTVNLVQDTFVEITSDHPDLDSGVVQIQGVFVAGKPDSALCPFTDVQFCLTRDQPAYWTASTGMPGPHCPNVNNPASVSPFTIVDFEGEVGTDDPDTFRNPGGHRLIGYILLWAVDPDGREIRWNHLTARVTVVNYAEQSAWDYAAWSFRAVGAPNDRDVLLDPIGRLDLDGNEYQACPDQLLFDFFASELDGQNDSPFSRPGMPISQDTFLTLWAAYKDFVE